MADFTPEALAIPRFNPLQRANVVAPALIAVPANAPKTIYNEDLEQPCNTIVIQNQSTASINVAFNSNAGAGVFHRVLAACVNANDGLGGNMEVDVKGKGIRTISVYSGTAGNITVEKYQRTSGADQP